MLASVPVAHFTGAMISDLAVYSRAVQWKRQLNFWETVKEVSLLWATFELNNRNYGAWPCHLHPHTLPIRKNIVLISWRKAKGLLCSPLTGLKNLGEMEAVHASGLAPDFGSELINPWLPELLLGCRSLPGSPDRAGIAQR